MDAPCGNGRDHDRDHVSAATSWHGLDLYADLCRNGVPCPDAPSDRSTDLRRCGAAGALCLFRPCRRGRDPAGHDRETSVSFVDSLLAGLALVGNVESFLALFGGVVLGVIGGAIPRMSATMAVALTLPFTFAMQPITGILRSEERRVGKESVSTCRS